MARPNRREAARRFLKRQTRRHSILAEKWQEAFASVLPITLIVLILCFLWVPAPISAMMGFLMSLLLLGCYIAVFALAQFVPESFLALSFDAGGVTTGPMTVPFILALGVGVSAIRSDRNAENDSFGLVALSSVGPILAVMILSLIYRVDEAGYIPTALTLVEDTQAMTGLFAQAFPHYMAEVAIALLPIAAFFALFQVFVLRLTRREVVRIATGLVYTYLGLSLFLTGVNVGFLPMGNYLGQALGALPQNWILVPLGMLMGYFVVSAEPAVHVLIKQVYELTAGAIPQRRRHGRHRVACQGHQSGR